MSIFKYGPLKSVFALLSVILILPSALWAASKSVSENYELQNNHLAYLENEFYVDYTPCGEQTVTGFDIQKATEERTKFNEVRFIGTHNSYQIRPTEAYTKLYKNLDTLTFGLVKGCLTDFCSDYLTEQFESGIRSIELDIETIVQNGEVNFVVSHSPLIDITSNCYDFRKALREIKMWSDHNPNHLPITIIIEPKKDLLPINGMKNFSVKYAEIFDEVLKSELGNTLLTPAEMLRDYGSFAEMRENDDWLTLDETLGKILVLLHETTVTEKYIARDESIKTQAMFPMLRFKDINKSYASFIIDNKSNEALKNNKKTIEEKNLIVRTRADSFGSFSNKKYAESLECGSQIISTDYPIKVNNKNDHVFDFGNGATVELINNS